ncbi:carboxypeptidase-like regulatory domain-containing protein [Roseomonas marmotae]|uniref:Carboxypeptidase regulatory-like domain-containing protein n=1 Tax=Roseomonas marmotae TaxID=2768161 RepID=A0ABS3KFD7_9PROT|nr:carboxypeptidase-like regulatory domain-containing protein [Roseomonas marmotae]MBO1076186.1 carboxypeptidase regulatory-like domain-containing protein [Roseomonas marmotae]QTI81778.1 carboxypeptidase regulatory-like domain-containing protein [Roseomonas marmotae]
MRAGIILDLTARRLVLAVLRVLDEDGVTPVHLPETPPAADDPRVVVLVREPGLLAIAGDPSLLLLPGPGNPPAVTLNLRLTGFRPAEITMTLPPAAVPPVGLPDLILRRLPKDLNGRIVVAVTGAPLSGIAVTIAPASPLTGHPLLLSPVLAADVPAGTDVRGFGLSPVGGAVPLKHLHAPAEAGSTAIELDDRQDLAVGQILRFGPPGRRSFGRVTFVAAGPAPLTAPGLVLLGAPLSASLRQGDEAEAFTLGVPAGPGTTTLGQAYAGEGMLVTAAAVAPGAVLAIGPAATAALHGSPALSDADGRYRIPGLARLPRLTASVAAPGFAPRSRTVVMAADGGSSLDWRLTP